MAEAAQKHILIVEDEEAEATLLKLLLESAGFQVHTEAGGKLALGYAFEHRPDLVILDLKLPDMHGYEVCQAMRKLSHPWPVPIVMLTGMERPIDQVRGFAFGADAYLTKPCDSNELLKTIEQLVQP